MSIGIGFNWNHDVVAVVRGDRPVARNNRRDAPRQARMKFRRVTAGWRNRLPRFFSAEYALYARVELAANR